MPCLFCVMHKVSGRYIDCSIITWCLERYGHFDDVILNWHHAYSIGGATKLAIRLFFYSYSAISGGGLRWFACFSSFLPPIVPNSGGGLSYSHEASSLQLTQPRRHCRQATRVERWMLIMVIFDFKNEAELPLVPVTYPPFIAYGLQCRCIGVPYSCAVPCPYSICKDILNDDVS